MEAQELVVFASLFVILTSINGEYLPVSLPPLKNYE